tara:strand:+ start:1659 stop:1844 length:186 start_codon:yes stop_codon:yes gene_type:complete
MKEINCEPNWQGMFDFAIAIVKTNVPKDQGKETVVEMLEFGKRLQAFHEKVKIEKERLLSE